MDNVVGSHVPFSFVSSWESDKKTNSWNPNPAYVGESISGQVQGNFDPSSLDGGGSGPFFVIYNWTTAGVWYSQDGTAGSFEPYGGDGVVSWQQGQANTTF